MELMKQYKEELGKYEAEQRELANAEKLFDLPITQYPELLAAQKEMRSLEMIYQIYDDQKVCQKYFMYFANLLNSYNVNSFIGIYDSKHDVRLYIYILLYLFGVFNFCVHLYASLVLTVTKPPQLS